MMGETGPCGPCSELHIDLTPDGKSKGKLVNADSHHCIEIWNLVFIQYNRKPGGTLEKLPAQHVDTGMGFERITSVLQGLRSNYDSDIFSPLFAAIKERAGEEDPAERRKRKAKAMYNTLSEEDQTKVRS